LFPLLVFPLSWHFSNRTSLSPGTRALSAAHPSNSASLSPSRLRPSRFVVGYSFWLADRLSPRLVNARAPTISPCSCSVRSTP
jgi:hypothetical protein